MRRNRRRANVNGNTIGGLNKARINRDNIVTFANSNRHLPFALAQRLLQPAQHCQIGHTGINVPLSLQRFYKACEIRRWAINIRLSHFNKIEANNRLKRNRARLGLLTNHLPMHLAFRWHINDDITAQLRLTAQATMLTQCTALGCITLLNRIPFRQMISSGLNAMLGKIAFCHQDLTTAANATATAYAIHINAQRTRGFKHACAFSKVAALARRREDDTVLFGHG